MEFLSQLNEKQLEAVHATEGYVRVIAGAGSGKTKLLVSRYAYLVKDYGIDSANILCVTFTNKAAGEMKKRIRALIGSEYDTTLICTYHGFCARLLRENPEKLFMTKGFQIIDTVQQKSILEEIYQKHELKLDHASFESILKKIGVIKNNTDYVTKMCDPRKVRILDTISDIDDEIIEEFMQRQKAIYALDFHDLLNFALYLLETNDEIREKWQDRLNYIQVDEFQDSSSREMKLIDILADKYRNLMIVGDPDQNIYEWRGSDVTLLVDFDKYHTPTQTIFLNRNYRSTPQILKCANALIDKNKIRLKKDLFTLSPAGADVIHYHSKSDSDEVTVISGTIKRMKKENGMNYSDFAILYRSGFLSRIIEKKMVESNIPYEIFGGVKFYQRMEVLDVIAYLRLIAFDDDIAFKRIINTPRRKFGRAKLSALENIRENEAQTFNGDSPSLFASLKSHLSDSVFKSSGANDFVGFIDEMRKASKNMRISEIVRCVTADSGYEQYIRELGDEERLENLAEFKRIADEFEKSFGEELNLPEFLQQIALQSSENSDNSRDAVKLMTIHSSKGLEFPAVFVVGFTEGIFPSSKSIEERKILGLEEERRLCYVAITRAQKYLFLMDSEGFSQSGIKKLPSRFLNEIGKENYTRIGEIPEDLECERRAYVHRTSKQLEKESEKNIGDKVEHHIFGKGEIISNDEKRGSYVIRFADSLQTRTISKEYFAPKSDEQCGSEEDDAPVAFPLSVEYVPNEENLTDVAFDKLQQNGNGKIKLDEKPNEDSEQDNTESEFEEIERIVEPKQLEFECPAEEIVYEEYMSEEERPSEKLRKKSNETDNLWKRDDVPHSGWKCIGVSDLGAPTGVCEMCGYQIIRYVHHMVHPHFSRVLGVGCVCAGKLEGNIQAAKKREQEFKNKESRRESFQKKKWKVSKNGNSYLKIKNHIIVLYKKKSEEVWKYSIDNSFCVEIFPTREEAIDAAFEALDRAVFAIDSHR